MLRRLLERLGRAAGTGPAVAPRTVRESADPAVVYVVGDVHGRIDLLRPLEREIAADAAAFSGERWMVLLGDLVDRGPGSAQVLDHVLAPAPPGLRRLCLMGNHEQMLLAFLRRPRVDADWLRFGGRETLLSYGIDIAAAPARHWSDTALRLATEAGIPRAHVDFLAALPHMIETPSYIFVHAGLQPGIALAAQAASDLLWYRDDFLDSFSEFGKLVVHGHSIVPTPLLTAHRICVDTGAFHSGVLSAVRLAPGLPPRLLASRAAG